MKVIYFVVAVIVANVLLFVLGVFGIFDGWPLYLIPLFQIAWLYGLGGGLHLPVEGKASEFVAAPNPFGWLLVILGSLITISIYVYLARLLFKPRA